MKIDDIRRTVVTRDILSKISIMIAKHIHGKITIIIVIVHIVHFVNSFFVVLNCDVHLFISITTEITKKIDGNAIIKFTNKVWT